MTEMRHEVAETAAFTEPPQPKMAHTYTRVELRDAATAPLIDEGDEFGDDVHDVVAAQSGLRGLIAAGMLDGPRSDVLGRPRSYKIARVVDLAARWLPTQGAPPFCRVAHPSHPDNATFGRPLFWGCPRKINIIQYHGEPLSPRSLVGGFDLLPPQVSVGVVPGTARLAFDCSPAAEAAIANRELRFTPNTWGASYDGTDTKALLRVALTQMNRIDKYVTRGFDLTMADGTKVEWSGV